MKLYQLTLGLLMLFSLSETRLAASTSSAILRTLKFVVLHPKQAAIQCITMGTEGFIGVCSISLASEKFLKCVEYIRSDDDQHYRRAFKSLFMCAGLASLAFECGKGLVGDLKELK